MNTGNSVHDNDNDIGGDDDDDDNVWPIIGGVMAAVFVIAVAASIIIIISWICNCNQNDNGGKDYSTYVYSIYSRKLICPYFNAHTYIHMYIFVHNL